MDLPGIEYILYGSGQVPDPSRIDDPLWIDFEGYSVDKNGPPKEYLASLNIPLERNVLIIGEDPSLETTALSLGYRFSNN